MVNNNGRGNPVNASQTQIVNGDRGAPFLQLRAFREHEQQRGQQEQREQDSTRGSSSRPSVRWQNDVVDNEDMNKKKTKICCIFHPQEDPDAECEDSPDHNEEPCTSSSSSSSSSESDEERGSGFEERRARRVIRRHRKLTQKRSESPNAYEVQPDYTKHKNHK